MHTTHAGECTPTTDRAATHTTDMMTPRHQRQWQCLIHTARSRCGRTLQHRHDRTPSKTVAVPYPWRCDRPLQHRPQPSQQHSGCAIHWSLSLVCRPSGGGRAVNSVHSVGVPSLQDCVVFQWSGTAGGTHQQWFARCLLYVGRDQHKCTRQQQLSQLQHACRT